GGTVTFRSTAELAGNVISNNTLSGIRISDPGPSPADPNTSLNVVADNYVGTNPTGTVALPNGTGIEIQNGASGKMNGPGDVISGNSAGASGDGNGIDIDGAVSGTYLGAHDNVIQGNFIGTDKDGATAIPNGNEGISIYLGAIDNTIGGTSTAERNVISGNS